MKSHTSAKEFRNVLDEMLYDFQSKDFFATIYEEPEDEYNEDDEILADREHRWEADNDR